MRVNCVVVIIKEIFLMVLNYSGLFLFFTSYFFPLSRNSIFGGFIEYLVVNLLSANFKKFSGRVWCCMRDIPLAIQQKYCL